MYSKIGEILQKRYKFAKIIPLSRKSRYITPGHTHTGTLLNNQIQKLFRLQLKAFLLLLLYVPLFPSPSDCRCACAVERSSHYFYLFFWPNLNLSHSPNKSNSICADAQLILIRLCKVNDHRNV